MRTKRLLRMFIGWGLMMFSAFSLAASMLLLVQQDYGASVIGVLFTLVVFALGLQIDADMEKSRKRILALMKKNFPICPICKSNSGYETRGWAPSSQYVKCKNCGAQWTSMDFRYVDTRPRKLKTLKLWDAPEDPEVFATFLSESSLKVKKTYPTELWKAAMKGETIEISTKERSELIKEFILTRKKGMGLGLISSIIFALGLCWLSSNYSLGCAATSVGVSTLTALFGYYVFSMSEAKAYSLFVTASLAIFGLLVLPLQ